MITLLEAWSVNSSRYSKGTRETYMMSRTRYVTGPDKRWGADGYERWTRADAGECRR